MAETPPSEQNDPSDETDLSSLSVGGMLRKIFESQLPPLVVPGEAAESRDNPASDSSTPYRA